MYLVILLMSLFSLFVQAKCRDVNLYQIDNSPLKKIPVYDQDGAGLCYAYTASQLVNYYLIQNNYAKSPVIHPAWAGVITAKDSYTTYGGFPDHAIESLKENYYCDYSSVVKAMENIGSNSKLTEPMVIAFLEKFVKNYKRLLKIQNRNSFLFVPPAKKDNTHIFLARNIPFEFQPINKNKELAEQAFKDTQKEMEGICKPNQTEILKDLVMENFMSSVSKISLKIIFKECKILSEKKSLPANMRMSKMIDKVVVNNETIQNQLNQGLKDNRPLGISYCSGFIRENSKRLLKTINSKHRKGLKGCDAHASIVVGSRKTPSSCEYMIKNTWGSGYWAGINKCFCQNKKTKKNVDNCTSITHPASEYTVLGCWFQSDDLASNIYDVIGVK